MPNPRTRRLKKAAKVAAWKRATGQEEVAPIAVIEEPVVETVEEEVVVEVKPAAKVVSTKPKKKKAKKSAKKKAAPKKLEVSDED